LDTIVDGIERFFLDVIGYVLPGLTLLVGGWLILGHPTRFGSIDIFPLAEGTGVVGLVTISYLLGYPIIAVGEIVLDWLMSRVPRIQSRRDIEEKVHSDPLFEIAVEQLKNTFESLEKVPCESASVRWWRGIAISAIHGQSQVIYRFTAIAQLNLGVATALFIVTIFSIFVGRQPLSERLGVVIPLLVLGILFLNRHQEFYRRSITLPFSMFLVQDIKKGDEKID